MAFVARCVFRRDRGLLQQQARRLRARRRVRGRQGAGARVQEGEREEVGGASVGDHGSEVREEDLPTLTTYFHILSYVRGSAGHTPAV